MGTSIHETVRPLRFCATGGDEVREKVIVALSAVGELWEQRLAQEWQPPDGSPFPWVQVRLSLAGLVPGLKNVRSWQERAGGRWSGNRVAALLLAGNTPLMSWSPLSACLLAGYSVVVKMSRDETLWPRLFVESLAEIDPGIAARIELAAWPGEDERTDQLVQAVDAVIAFGSDATIQILREKTPDTTPFFGFGHSISVGMILPERCPLSGMTDPFSLELASEFARDVLLYQQQGCLSPQMLLVEGEAGDVQEVTSILGVRLREEVNTLDIMPVTEPAVARTIRQVRDMALFQGVGVSGDEFLRWTILAYQREITLPPPIGYGVLPIIPVMNSAQVLSRWSRLVSCVGVVGKVTAEWKQELARRGISRLCEAGEMQTPPLDWPNGNIDLLAELLRLS